MRSYDPNNESSRLVMYDLSTGRRYQVLKDVFGMFGPAVSGNRIIYMDLAHIAPDKRDIQYDNPVQEISVFTLDPVVFALPSPVPAAMPGTMVQGSPPSPPATAAARSPGFGVSSLAILVIAVLLSRVRER